MRFRTAKKILKILDTPRLCGRSPLRPDKIHEALGIMSRAPRAVERLVCRPTRIRFWGQYSVVTPALVYQRFGDGRCWGTLSPMNTRPNFYLIMGDSSWEADPDSDSFRDAFDEEIYPAIDEQYGTTDFWCDVCDKEYAEIGDECCLPDRAFPSRDPDGSVWCFPCYPTGWRDYHCRQVWRRRKRQETAGRR